MGKPVHYEKVLVCDGGDYLLLPAKMRLPTFVCS
jgi:hypothetical protein